MHGFSTAKALEFLQGAVVTRVCVQRYQADIHLEPEANLRIEGKVVHRVGSEGRDVIHERGGPTGPNEFWRLLGQTITGLQPQPPDSLRISFSNGDSLTLVDDSEQYESFVIEAPGQIVVI